MSGIGFDNIPSKGSSFKLYQDLKIPTSNPIQEENPHSQRRFGLRLISKFTTGYIQTLKLCSPGVQFNYRIPQRVLTYPSEEIYNDGFDNYNNDYILKVHDSLMNLKQNQTYTIIDLIGKGSFGQVVKCFRENDRTFHAIKVTKNIPQYKYQALHEIEILMTINQQEDQFDDSERRIIKLEGYFKFRNHICLIFPLLDISLFDFLQGSKFEGLSMELIRTFLKQILQGVKTLHENKITHCDLKPENILLLSKRRDQIKIIDLGSAQMSDLNQFYEIQSLFYRAPEVMIGLPQTPQIDMWSIGCIAAELYLGQPLFYGSSSYEILKKISSIGIINQCDSKLIEQGTEWQQFFKLTNQNTIRLKNIQEYHEDSGLTIQNTRQVHQTDSFDCLLHQFDKSQFRTPDQKKYLDAFIDFLKKILQFQGEARMTPDEALQHPFIKEQDFIIEFKTQILPLLTKESYYDNDDDGSTQIKTDSDRNGQTVNCRNNSYSLFDVKSQDDYENQKHVSSQKMQNILELNRQKSHLPEQSRLHSQKMTKHRCNSSQDFKFQAEPQTPK